MSVIINNIKLSYSLQILTNNANRNQMFLKIIFIRIMAMENAIRYSFLFLLYLNADALGEKLIIRYIIGYFKFEFFFFLRLTYIYLKCVGVCFIWYKALFFTNFLPSFIQV